ncbi:MAG: hypothetical protein M0Z38_00145 [Deltaproteobacteria bacterium]|nr:hypothetical protein [Deltaproteobacteria bacterium]
MYGPGSCQAEKIGHHHIINSNFCQVGVIPRRIDILTSIDGVDFDEAWRDRTEVDIEDLKVPVIGRLHLIRNKKAVGRQQDLADIARLEGGDE